jgi:ABC-type sulfate/molybdate transport systems ATPase subunit
VSQPVLRARGLTVLRGGRAVVHALDMDLRRGEVVALLGPNGAGKTTLLAALAGLVQSESGTIERVGRVAAALQTPALARRTALGNVEAALGWWGVPREERRARAQGALDSFGVGALAARRARTLSGGETRRVHLARAVAVAPDVLLLDEPFAGLDASARADLLYDAATVLRSPDRATLVIVHDRAEAWALADRMLVMIGGRLRAEGPPTDILERPPTPEVATFLGFSGHIREDAGMRLVRPAHVILDRGGPIEGTVARRVPLEDGVRLEIDVDAGRLVAIAPVPGPPIGERVRLRVDGGAVYPTEEAA